MFWTDGCCDFTLHFLFRIDQKQKYTNKSSQYTLQVSLQGEVCLLAQTSPPYPLFLECIQNSAYLILELQHLLWKPEYKKMNTD